MQGFGAKVDARLRELEAKIHALDGIKHRAVEAEGFGAILPGLQKLDEQIGEIMRRIDALEAKRGPGRPPKNG